MRKLWLFFFLLPLLTFGQDPTPPSELSGSELRDWLRDNWYLPWHNDLGYGPAREAMYGTIDNQAGLIECVYTGFTQPAEEVTFPDPINTEHTVPQSFFDGQLPMRSDIHHLFPTHQVANSDRGSMPFDEVVDSQADEWIIGTGGDYSSSSNIPSSNIDAYSEVHHGVAFEPREENKGNVARAVLYFYTMYPSVGDIAAVGDLDIFYQWHQNDPPDAEEIERNEEIQGIQGNYNPYISLPEIAGTAWGLVSSLTEEAFRDELFYDPASNCITWDSDLSIEDIMIIDMRGSSICVQRSAGRIELPILSSGIYLISISTSSSRLTERIFVQ